MARVGLSVAFISVCSVIAIPIGSIPVTLSLFALMLTALLLSPFETLFAVLVYIALGAIGAPVFSGGGSGLGVLTGPTGGFLMAYPVMTSIISVFRMIYEKRRPQSGVKYTLLLFAACAATLPVCYFLGTLHFVNYAAVSVKYALSVCVIPFILPDLIKAALAVWISDRVRPHIRSAAR